MALQLFLAAFASIVSHAPEVITRVNTQTETSWAATLTAVGIATICQVLTASFAMTANH